jgi:hypothetical protein
MRRMIFFLLAGCGGSDLEVGFAIHRQVSCKSEGLAANLEASGIEGVCPLIVNEDRTVSGVCHAVKTGEPRAFRLVYYMTLDREYELAVAQETLDLTEVKRKTIVLTFEEEGINIDIDDDGDTFLNVEEFCCGSHPGINSDVCP